MSLVSRYARPRVLRFQDGLAKPTCLNQRRWTSSQQSRLEKLLLEPAARHPNTIITNVLLANARTTVKNFSEAADIMGAHEYNLAPRIARTNLNWVIGWILKTPELENDIRLQRRVLPELRTILAGTDPDLKFSKEKRNAVKKLQNDIFTRFPLLKGQIEALKQAEDVWIKSMKERMGPEPGAVTSLNAALVVIQMAYGDAFSVPALEAWELDDQFAVPIFFNNIVDDWEREKALSLHEALVAPFRAGLPTRKKLFREWEVAAAEWSEVMKTRTYDILVQHPFYLKSSRGEKADIIKNHIDLFKAIRSIYDLRIKSYYQIKGSKTPEKHAVKPAQSEAEIKEEEIKAQSKKEKEVTPQDEEMMKFFENYGKHSPIRTFNFSNFADFSQVDLQRPRKAKGSKNKSNAKQPQPWQGRGKVRR